jgi:hypothetical protein
MQSESGCRRMTAEDRLERPSLLQGHVRAVDVVGRVIQVHSADRLFEVDVPTGCAVWLNGERVKLRLLVPGDFVEVDVSSGPGLSVARSIRVCTAPPGSARPRCRPGSLSASGRP